MPEVPLVISSTAFSIAKTAGALKLLTAIGAGPDILKVRKSKKTRAGRGKLRGRRFRQRRGPLVVYDPEADGLDVGRSFRNIPGVESCSVYALNLLQLAPGGHLGRFIIWTSSAFSALDKVYGSTTEPSALKKDFLLPSALVKQPDLNKLISSSEIQAAIRPTKGHGIQKRAVAQKKNPLINRQVLLRLNPYAAQYSKDKIGSTKLESEKPKAVNAAFSETFKSD